MLPNTEVNSNKEGFVICLAFIKFFGFQAGISKKFLKRTEEKKSLPRTTKALVSEKIFISGITSLFAMEMQ